MSLGGDGAGVGSRSTLVELSINFVHYSTINRTPTRGTPSIPAFGVVLIIDIGDIRRCHFHASCRLVGDFLVASSQPRLALAF